MPELKNKGVIYHYEIYGEGKPFVFLHGLGGSIQQILSAYQPIDGIELITMDQMGHGRSGFEEGALSFDRMGDDVVALLDHLGLKGVYLGGISMGAAVSLNVAVRYPEYVKKLLLVRPAWTDKVMSDRVIKLFSLTRDALAEKKPAVLKETAEFAEIAAESSYTTNAFLGFLKDEVSQKYYQKYEILPREAPIQDMGKLKDIRVETSVVGVPNDIVHPFVYAQFLAEHIPNAMFHEIVDKDKAAAEHGRMLNEKIKEFVGDSL